VRRRSCGSIIRGCLNSRCRLGMQDVIFTGASSCLHQSRLQEPRQHLHRRRLGSFDRAQETRRGW
jgi:hypothetical protein